MAAIGIACVSLSAFNASSYLAILGVTMIFWGSILLYVAPSKRVPLAFLTASTATGMSNIERILSELKYKQKAIYLPPKNLQAIESSLAFIPQKSNQTLPETTGPNDSELFNKNHNGLFLTPPGFNLSKIYEEKIGLSFTKLNLKDLQRTLSKVLTEDLEIMEDLEIGIQDDEITLEIKGSIFDRDCQETEKYPQAHATVGCLLSSSFACALAKVSGKPIVIQNEERTEDGKTTRIQFKVLED